MRRYLLTCLACAGLSLSAPAQPNLDPIFSKPMYRTARWGLRVVDARTGEVLLDKEPDHLFYIGSIRKIFSVGLLLNEVGPDHTYDTPVYKQGKLDAQGVLHGDLILKASGDLTMGGRRNADGSLAITDYDHNEANTLGSAILSAPDPLAGFQDLARQIAASGIKEVRGEVMVDDRLFQPFNFRGEFDVTPMFVNDDVVDLMLEPGRPIQHRPHSAALQVKDETRPGPNLDLKLEPEVPPLGGTGVVSGSVPADLVPPLTKKLPLVRNFRIADPSSYARTVLIETLQSQNVKVTAPVVEVNPRAQLPPRYQSGDQVAMLKGTPYGDAARLILKVSYNLGADTSLLLLGVAKGVDNLPAALAQERALLVDKYGLDPRSFEFVDGSGGGPTKASNAAVTTILAKMLQSPAAPTLQAALPSLGTDGSLGFVVDYQKDPTLAGATARVHAKTGTFLEGDDAGHLVVRGQGFGGYIEARSGRRLIYSLVVNEVPIQDLNDLLQIFQDEGTLSATLWRDF